jgi:Type III restriction enzyme, res subunit
MDRHTGVMHLLDAVSKMEGVNVQGWWSDVHAKMLVLIAKEDSVMRTGLTAMVVCGSDNIGSSSKLPHAPGDSGLILRSHEFALKFSEAVKAFLSTYQSMPIVTPAQSAAQNLAVLGIASPDLTEPLQQKSSIYVQERDVPDLLGSRSSGSETQAASLSTSVAAAVAAVAPAAAAAAAPGAAPGAAAAAAAAAPPAAAAREVELEQQLAAAAAVAGAITAVQAAAAADARARAFAEGVISDGRQGGARERCVLEVLHMQGARTAAALTAAVQSAALANGWSSTNGVVAGRRKGIYTNSTVYKARRAALRALRAAAAAAVTTVFTEEHKQVCAAVTADVVASETAAPTALAAATAERAAQVERAAAAKAVVQYLVAVTAAADADAVPPAAASDNAEKVDTDYTRAQKAAARTMSAFAHSSQRWPAQSDGKRHAAFYLGVAASAGVQAGVLARAPNGTTVISVTPWASVGAIKPLMQHYRAALERGIVLYILIGYMEGVLLPPGMLPVEHRQFKVVAMLRAAFSDCPNFKCIITHHHGKCISSVDDVSTSASNSRNIAASLNNSAEVGVIALDAAAAAAQQSLMEYVEQNIKHQMNTNSSTHFRLFNKGTVQYLEREQLVLRSTAASLSVQQQQQQQRGTSVMLPRLYQERCVQMLVRQILLQQQLNSQRCLSAWVLAVCGSGKTVILLRAAMLLAAVTGRRSIVVLATSPESVDQFVQTAVQLAESGNATKLCIRRVSSNSYTVHYPTTQQQQYAHSTTAASSTSSFTAAAGFSSMVCDEQQQQQLDSSSAAAGFSSMVCAAASSASSDTRPLITITVTSIQQQLQPSDFNQRLAAESDLLVVDEAHRFQDLARL